MSALDLADLNEAIATVDAALARETSRVKHMSLIQIRERLCAIRDRVSNASA